MPCLPVFHEDTSLEVQRAYPYLCNSKDLHPCQLHHALHLDPLSGTSPPYQPTSSSHPTTLLLPPLFPASLGVLFGSSTSQTGLKLILWKIDWTSSPLKLESPLSSPSPQMTSFALMQILYWFPPAPFFHLNVCQGSLEEGVGSDLWNFQLHKISEAVLEIRSYRWRWGEYKKKKKQERCLLWWLRLMTYLSHTPTQLVNLNQVDAISNIFKHYFCSEKRNPHLDRRCGRVLV